MHILSKTSHVVFLLGIGASSLRCQQAVKPADVGAVNLSGAGLSWFEQPWFEQPWFEQRCSRRLYSQLTYRDKWHNR